MVVVCMKKLVNLLEKGKKKTTPVLAEPRKKSGGGVPAVVEVRGPSVAAPTIQVRKQSGDGVQKAGGKSQARRSQKIDVDEALVEKYDPFEEAVQNAEMVDGVISNLGLAAAIGSKALPSVSKIVPSASRAAPILTGTSAVATKIAPVQAALWGLDGVRGVVDEEYRAETLSSIDALFDDSDKTTKRKAIEMFLNTLARPVSVGGGMIRSYNESNDKIRNSEDALERAEKRFESRQDGKKKKKEQERWAGEVDDVRKYIEEAGQESRGDFKDKEIEREAINHSFDRFDVTERERERMARLEMERVEEPDYRAEASRIAGMIRQQRGLT